MRIPPILFVPLTRLKNTVRKQIERIITLVESAVERVSGDGGRVRVSSLGTVALPVIYPGVDQSVAKDYESSVFQTAVGYAVYKCVAENHALNIVAKCTFGASAFTVPVAKFIISEVEKCSVGNAKVKEGYNKLHKTVDDHKVKTEVKNPAGQDGYK